jgi:glutaredoxin-like protein
MALLDSAQRQELAEEFEAKLVNPVRLAVFSQTLAMPGQEALASASERTRQLVEELASLHPDLSAESRSYLSDREWVKDLAIERIPAIAVLREREDPGVRLYGRIEGYEFAALIDAILDTSADTSALSEETTATLADLERRVHIQVFSTPTCPHCPHAVRLAHQFALASENVSADAIEVTGYPELAERYQIAGVPKTVVEDTAAGRREEFVGAGPEAMLLEHILKAAAPAE